MKYIKPFLFLFLLSSSAFAINPVEEMDTTALDSLLESVNSDSIWAANLKYETGTVSLANGIAEIKVPAGYKYLNAADSRKLFVLWGNPDDSTALGLLMKKDESPAT